MSSSSSPYRSPLTAKDEIWAKKFYLQSLRQKYFLQWRAAQQLPQPFARGSAIYAGVKWVALVFDREKLSPFESQKAVKYEFPFYAAREKDGSASRYFLSRIRNYLIDKLEIPVENLPLFTHTIALLDAFTLKRIFRGWKSLCRFAKQLDQHYRVRKLRRALRFWHAWWRRRDVYRVKRRVLMFHKKDQNLQYFFAHWKLMFKAAFFHRKVSSAWYRRRHSLKQIQCQAWLIKWQRYVGVQGQLHYEKMQKKHTLQRLLQALCPLAKVKQLSQSKQVRRWVLNILHIQAATSLYLQQVWQKEIQHRSRFYLNYPLLHHFFDSSSVALAEKVSSEQKEQLRQWIKVLEVIQIRRRSRKSQAFMSHAAGLFHLFRLLHRYLRRWMLRVPQRVLDSATNTAIFATMKQYARQSRSIAASPSRMLFASPSGFDRSVFTSSSPSLMWNGNLRRHQMQHALSKWHRVTSTSRYHRQNYLYLHHRSSKSAAMKALGAWVMVAARFKQVHVASNRIICNQIQKQLWYGWFAWRNQYERSVLIRHNQKELIALRTAEIREYAALQQQRHQEDLQYSVLKSWARFVRRRQQGKKLSHILLRYYGRDNIFNSFHRWKTILALDYIVNSVKKLWYGYRARFLHQPQVYQYLKWYRSRVPNMLQFAQLHRIQRNFSRWRSMLTKAYQYSEHRRKFVALKSAMRKLWRLLIRGKRMNRKLTSIATSICNVKFVRKCFQFLKARGKRQKAHRELSIGLHYRFSLKQSLGQWIVFSRRELKKKSGVRNYRQRNLQSKFVLWYKVAQFKAHNNLKSWQCWRQSRLRQYLNRWRRYRSYWSFLCRHDKSRQLFPRATDTSYSVALRNALTRHGNFGRAGSGPRSSSRVKVVSPKKAQFDHFGTSLTSKRGYCSVAGRKAIKHWKAICATKQRLNQHYHDRIDILLKKKLKRAFRYLFVNWRQGLLKQYKYKGGKRVLQHSRVPRSSEGESESRRKYKHLISQMLKKRVRKQASFSENPFAVAAFRSFQMWQFSTAQHYRRKRLHSLKQYQFISYKLRRTMFRWQFWAQRHGKFSRQSQRTIIKHHRRVLLSALHCLQQNRLRQIRSTNTVKQFLNSKKDKLLMRYFLIKRWYFLVQKKKYRKYRKQKYGIVTGSGGGLVCIAKLRKRCAHFIERLRLIVLFRRQARRSQLPTWKQPVLVIEKKHKERLRLQFDKMKKRLAAQKFRHLIISLVNTSHREMKIKSAIRYWRKFVQYKRRMRKIIRRFYMVQALRTWFRSYKEQEHHVQILAHMHRKQRSRILSTFLIEWKRYTRKEIVLRGKFEIVQTRHRRWEKTRVTYAWLVVLDNALLRQRYDVIYAKHQERLRKQFFTHWHTLALLSEMYTYKNLTTCLQNWRSTFSSLRKQRASLQKAEVYHNSICCHRALQIWFKSLRRQKYLGKRQHAAFRRFLKHGLFRAFRCWKRRMHIRHRQSIEHVSKQHYFDMDLALTTNSTIGRRIRTMTQSTLAGHRSQHSLRFDRSVKMHPSDDQKDALVQRAELHRVLMHFHRYAKRRSKKRRVRVLSKVVTTWRSHTRAQSLLRQAFAARLALVRRKELLTIVWRSLYSIWHSQKVLENTTHLHKLHVQHRTLKQWFAQKQVVLHKKATMKYVLHCIYKFQVLRCFLTWKVRASIAQRLHQSVLCTHVWKRWNAAYKAVRFRRLLLLVRTMTAWKGLIRWYRHHNNLFFLRRRKLYDLMCKTFSRERYFVKMAFKKWQRGDMSARFTIFCQEEDDQIRAAHYQSQLIAPGTVVEGFHPLHTTVAELAKSQAARILLLQDTIPADPFPADESNIMTNSVLWTSEEIAQCKSRQPHIKIPRSVEILAHFRNHCETVLETEDMQRSKSAKIRERLMQSNRFDEEKLNYDNIPLREKMSIATSPQRARRSRSPFIGLRSSASIIRPPTSYDHEPVTSFSSRRYANTLPEDEFFMQEPTMLGDESVGMGVAASSRSSRIHLQELM